MAFPKRNSVLLTTFLSPPLKSAFFFVFTVVSPSLILSNAICSEGRMGNVWLYREPQVAFNGGIGGGAGAPGELSSRPGRGCDPPSRRPGKSLSQLQDATTKELLEFPNLWGCHACRNFGRDLSEIWCELSDVTFLGSLFHLSTKTLNISRRISGEISENISEISFQTSPMFAKLRGAAVGCWLQIWLCRNLVDQRLQFLRRDTLVRPFAPFALFAVLLRLRSSAVICTLFLFLRPQTQAEGNRRCFMNAAF